MPAHLAITVPGLHTTIQDAGRAGYLDIGVPPSGALDLVNLRLANALAGNPQNEAVLEILHHGPEFIVEAESVQLTLSGEDSVLEVLEPQKKRFAQSRSIMLNRGAKCRVILNSRSSSAYLAVKGGFDLKPVMGSVSTYVRGHFGGLAGRALQAGDRVPLRCKRSSTSQALCFKKHLKPMPAGPVGIRVVPGPQQQYLTHKARQIFYSETFTYSPNADRMGVRLDGPLLDLKDIEGFVSDGIIAGAIQVPGSGQPIILLADHQTSGGYPKIATVISTDLPLLGRLGAGGAIRFQPVDVAEAEALRYEQECEIEQIIKSLAPVLSEIHLELGQLSSGNLISGVVDAKDDKMEIS